MPLGELPGFEDGVAGGHRAAGGILPDDWRRRSLHIDLGAWAGFLGRPRNLLLGALPLWLLATVYRQER
jgi:hypothetical protein